MPTLEDIFATASDVTAGGASIHFAAPGGLYDQLSKAIEESDILPKRKISLLAVIGGTLTASSILKRQLGNSPITNFLGELTSSANRQLAQRALNPRDTNCVRLESSAPPAHQVGRDALFALSAEIQEAFLKQYDQLETEEQREMFKHLVKQCDSVQLTRIAQMSRENIGILLSFLTKKSLAKTVSDSVGDGLQTITDQINRWSGRNKKQ